MQVKIFVTFPCKGRGNRLAKAVDFSISLGAKSSQWREQKQVVLHLTYSNSNTPELNYICLDNGSRKAS